MHRSHLLSQLSHYHPSAPEEQQFKQDMITFINRHPNCFERSLEIGHITASAWLLNKEKNAALLMHHAKLNNWFQLGGHCDGNPDVLSVAIREAQEESGIEHIEALNEAIFDIDVHLIPANRKEKEHYHYDVRFLLCVKSDETVVQNSESNELRWIKKDRAALPTQSRSILRMFDKWISMDTNSSIAHSLSRDTTPNFL